MPELAVVENAEFEEPGGLQKREGYARMSLLKLSSGVAVSRIRALGRRDDELTMFAEGKAWSYLNAETDWVDRGRYESVLVDQRQVYHDRADQVRADRAELSGVVLHAWQDLETTGVRWRCEDKVTGATYGSVNATFVSNATRPQCRAVGAKLHLYYVSAVSDLYVLAIDPTDVYGTINGTPTKLVTTDVGGGQYDVVSESDGAFSAIAYRTIADKYRSGRVTAAGAWVGGAGFPLLHNYNCNTVISIAHNASADKVAVLRVDDTGENEAIKHDYLTQGTHVDSIMDNTVTDETSVPNLACALLATTITHCMWDIAVANTPIDDMAKKATVNAAGAVGSIDVLARHCQLGSRAVVWDDGTTERILVHVLHQSTNQPVYVLLDAAHVVGAENDSRSRGDEVGLMARLLPGQAQQIALVAGVKPQIELVATNTFACVLGNRRRLDTTGSPVYAERGLVDFVYTLADARAYRGVEEGKSLYLPGGYLARYDGVRVTESDIWIFPETDEITVLTDDATTGGGALTSGKSYNYHFYWERIDSEGERQLSSFAGALTVAMGGDTAVRFTVRTNPFTNDDNLVLAGFRTKHTPGPDATYYRWTSLDPTVGTFKKNLPNADTITLDDGMADAVLITKELDYQNPTTLGTVLDNVPPPATHIVAVGQSRLFTVDPEDRSTVYFSKIRGRGDGVSFNEALTIQVPQVGGDVTAIDATEDGLYILKTSAIYYVGGQGPDNLGNNPYPAPQLVADGIGCEDARSMVRCAAGLIFRSEKGFYMLGDSGAVTYIGAGAEDLDGTDIAGAVVVPDKHHVRFLLTGTGMLVYDYLIGQWSSWPGRFGDSITYWNSDTIILDDSQGSNIVLRRNDGDYQDDEDGVTPTGYGLVAETPWIKLDGLQGYGRIRKIAVLAENMTAGSDAHAVRIRVAYGYNESWVQDDTWTVSPAVAGPQQHWIRVASGRGKTDAVKIRIEDIAVSGDETNWQQSMKLTGLTLEIGRKTGVKRLPAAQKS
jgi:hypothetical protein